MAINNDLLRDAWDTMNSCQTFVIACHENPDGDALGASLALSRALRAAGKDVTVVCKGGLVESYDYIPDQRTLIESTNRRGFDVGILMDCEGLGRAGSAADAVASARTTACIDHHIPVDEFGDIRIVDQMASSTSELVLRLLEANNVSIDVTAATQLMIGLVNDTGGFRFANTSAETFRVAARLSDLGADASYAARNVYETRSLAALRLLGRALVSLQATGDSRVVWSVITRQDLDELDARDSDTDGIVNHVGQARGAEVAVLFRQLQQEEIRVSLRSRGGFDVNRVARVFGGGGHTAAAGCTMKMPLDSAREAVLSEVVRWMES